MGKKEKLIARLRSRPKDLRWSEMTAFLTALGYAEAPTGRSGGSRRRFAHPEAAAIVLHKPHPQDIVKRYAIDQVLSKLEDEGLL